MPVVGWMEAALDCWWKGTILPACNPLLMHPTSPCLIDGLLHRGANCMKWTSEMFWWYKFYMYDLNIRHKAPTVARDRGMWGEKLRSGQLYVQHCKDSNIISLLQLANLQDYQVASHHPQNRHNSIPRSTVAITSLGQGPWWLAPAICRTWL